MPGSDIIALALTEDIGPGDVTARYFTDAQRQALGRIVAREECVLAGGETAREVFRRVDEEIICRKLAADGTLLKAGEVAMEVHGPARSILSAERVALNFLQRLSGVATMTRRYAAALEGTQTRLLDTRKTTPGWRKLEKAAVKAGGGENHRMGLYDMAMVKDNHLAAGGTIGQLKEGIGRLRAEHPEIKIELEADTLEQVKEFLELGVDVILLDNMTLEEMGRAVSWRKGDVKFEASGGVTLERLPEIARTGVDFVSVGALTHSCRAVDLSMEVVDEPGVA